MNIIIFLFCVLMGIALLMLIGLTSELVYGRFFPDGFRSKFCKHDYKHDYEYTRHTEFMGMSGSSTIVVYKCSKCGALKELNHG